MYLSDGMWIALFFLASGVMSVLIGRSEKKVREKKIEYFKIIPGNREEENQK
jgi:hypothetical protein